jgi:predicted  nucleic acid-binding Zn-ribbon protein
MYLQTICGLKHIIKRLWAKMRIGKRSTTTRFKNAEHICEEIERELSEVYRNSEDIQNQMLNIEAPVDALTVQMKVAETRASASTERVAALDSQLYKTQVNWKLRFGLMHL